MKKMLMLVVLVFMFSSVFAESVILNDGRILKGEIVGKNGDVIFFRSEGNTYFLTRDLVKQIKNDGGLTITKLTYKKNNFMENNIDVTQIIPIGEREEPITYDISDVVFDSQSEGISKDNIDGIYVNGININKLDIRYCEIVAEDKRFFSAFRKYREIVINIDYGQKINQQLMHTAKDSLGSDIKFNSLVEAFNFLNRFGWIFVTQYSIGSDGEFVYHFLFEKK